MCGFVNMQEPWLITVKLSVVLLSPFMAIKGLFFVCFKKKKKKKIVSISHTPPK